MRILTSLHILYLLTVGWFTHAVETHEIREPTTLEKEIFVLLKKKFPDEILDENLKTLHELAESPEYKTFLAKAYPAIKPIPAFAKIVNFEEVLHKILPPKKRYLTYYIKQFRVQRIDEVTNVEHFLVHYEQTHNWIFQAIERSRDVPISERTGGLHLSGRISAQLMRTMHFRKMLETRFEINANLKMTPEVMTQIVRHVKIPILNMTKQHLTLDARWIRMLIEKHGITDGMLWVALQDPILFERIRYAFTTDKTLLKYVYINPDVEEIQARKRHEKRLREFKEWQKRQRNN